MSERFIDGLGELARILTESAALHDEATELTAGLSSRIVYDKAFHIIGDNTKLAHLSEATQADRESKGYSPDEPLYRDGALLRDSLEHGHEGFLAGVGSSEPIFAYHELGYSTHPFGNKSIPEVSVPPRPDLKIAMQESAPDIEALVEENIAFSLGFGPRLEIKE